MRALRYIVDCLYECHEFAKDLFLSINAVFTRWSAWSKPPVQVLIMCLQLAFGVVCFVGYLFVVITFLLLCLYPLWKFSH